jgi:hypothetical protein
MAIHRKTTSHKVWDLKMVFLTTASSIRVPCNQSARVNLIAKAWAPDGEKMLQQTNKQTNDNDNDNDEPAVVA